MEYRTLGKTDLRVSALGLGGSSLGGAFRKVEEAEAICTVHTAFDLGINFVDTSPLYGVTKAETMLGKALKGVPRDRYLLGTKTGRFGEDVFDFSAARTKASLDESLKRLGVDYVDLLQAHDIEYRSLDQVIEETLPALREIQKAGKARFIGITGFPLKIFRYVLARADVDVFLTYCHYTLWDSTAADLAAEMEGKNLGVINAAAMGMGLLTKHGTPPWHPATAEIKSVCAQAVEQCTARSIDISELAVQFAVANTQFHTTLVGTADPEEVKRNVRAVEKPIDQGLLEEAQRLLAPIRNKTWTVGRAENN